ncbi:hypothetical protein Q3G72_010131 [Acer saccharum]|nr:hypothetical protein Q3G72_010131 [Acer saccharum]
MSTQKDHIEKLGGDMGKLKELVKAMAVESQKLVLDSQEKETPTEYEDFDEALLHVIHKGTLHEYQTEFEQLANCVDGWPQKALIGTFLGRLRVYIVATVKMFKPRTL